jgi:CRISPR-associated protein Csb2
MILKVDVTYPSRGCHASQFPLDFSCFFQACIAANAHRLDAARPALLALEVAECVAIDVVEAQRTAVTVTGPRLPKFSELRNYRLGDPANRLMVRQPVYRFANDGTHLSYYFSGEFTKDMLPFFSSVYRLGHGESLCVSKATLVDVMPSPDNRQRWEPVNSGSGRDMRILRVGLLDDLILYHTHHKGATEVRQETRLFTTHQEKTRTLFYRFYKADEPFYFHEWETAEVAGMLRYAVMSQVPGHLREYASNHAFGGDSPGRQVQYLPLPSIGHEYADKKIRRAAIVEKLGGQTLPIHRISELKLTSLDGRTYRAVRETEADGVFDEYTRPSKRWVSVTPVLLSGYDMKHGRKDVRKTQKMLAKELAAVGLRPVSVSLFDQYLDTKLSKHGQYVHTGVALEFDSEVSGLIVAGAGRNKGIGVFAAV